MLTGAEQIDQETVLLGFGPDGAPPIDDEQIQAGEVPQKPLGTLIGQGRRQVFQQGLQAVESPLVFCLTGAAAQRGGDMGLTGASLAPDQQGLALGDEAQLPYSRNSRR